MSKEVNELPSPRYGCRLPQEVYDTMYRMKQDTMIDVSKIVTQALKEYLVKNNYEIRLNTEEENKLIFNK